MPKTPVIKKNATPFTGPLDRLGVKRVPGPISKSPPVPIPSPQPAIEEAPLDELREKKSLEGEEQQAREPNRKYLPAGKGLTTASFGSDASFDERYMNEIGTKTRHIKIGHGWFTDKLINDLLYLGIGKNNVCANLKTLSIGWMNYDPREGWVNAHVTSEAMIAFAKACRNLTKVQIQNIRSQGVSDEVFMAFFKHCPGLKHFELVCHSNDHTMTAKSFDALLEKPGWGCELKDLILDGADERKIGREYMKSMRNLSKARHPQLKIQLTHKTNIGGNGKWKDENWVWFSEGYKNGRKQS